MMGFRRVEQLVEPFRWELVNCNNLVLDQKKYSDLLQLTKPDVELCQPPVEEDTSCSDRLHEISKEKEVEKDTKECQKLEVDIKYCEEKARERRQTIDNAKKILRKDSHENKIFNRAVFLVDVLEHNKIQVEENRIVEEETKFRNAEMELRFMKGEHTKEDEKKKLARQLRMKTVEDNLKLVQLNLEKRKMLDQENRDWAEEILCMSKEFMEEENRKATKNFEKRRGLDEANKLEIDRKEKLRQFNLKLEEAEDREANLFLDAKRNMYKDIISSSTKQVELRQKRLDLIVEKNKEWIRALDPEGVRDRWYQDICRREMMAKEKEEVIDVKKRKDAYVNLVKTWDEQIERKMKARCDVELEAKLCHEVRVQMDCDMKREDEERKRNDMTMAKKIVEYNKGLQNEKKEEYAFEKQYDKEHLDKMFEWFASEEKEQRDKSRCLIERYLMEGKNVIPLKRLDFTK